MTTKPSPKTAFLGAATLAAVLLSGCAAPGGDAGGRAPEARAPLVVVDTAPPPQRTEPPGRAPFSDAQWVPGYWNWAAGAFQWVPGQWVMARPGYKWQPYHWDRTADGRWQLSGGQWVRPSIADPLTRY